MQHGFCRGRVLEADLPVLDFAARTRHAMAAARVLGRRVEHVEEALRSGDALLQRPRDVDQAAQRRRDQHQRGDERGELADGHPPRNGVDRREVEHDRESRRGDRLHDGVAESLGQHQLHVRPPVVLDHLVEHARFVVLRVEHADHARCLDRLLGDARDVTHRMLDAAAVTAEQQVDAADQHGDQRADDQAEQREPRVHVQQVADESKDRQRVADEHRDRIGRRVGDLLGVVRQLREQHARGVAVEVGDRQVHEAVEDLRAQRLDHAPADVARAVGLHEIADAAQDEQPHQRDRHEPDHARVAVHERAVEEELHERRPAGVGRREQRHAEHAHGEHALVRAQVTEQAPVRLHGPGRHLQVDALIGSATHRGPSRC